MATVPRQATGRIEEDPWADGETVSFRLRVRAYGRRHVVTLGTNHEGWNRARAQVELDEVMKAIRRGTWEPTSARPSPSPAEEIDTDEETIHVTLSRWWEKKKGELADNTREDYWWRLRLILGFRPDTLTADIKARWVDELRDHLAKQKARNRKKPQPLSPRSVNMCLDVLAQGLDLAVRHEILDANPARTKGTKLKVEKSARSFLEPDMVVDLLDIAGEWEAELPEHQRYGRRALLALLCLGGPRISEAIKADRGEFDLAGGDRWRIPKAKSEAGARVVELTTFLTGEMRGHVAATNSLGRPVGPRKPMWPTTTGGRLNASNIRTRLLAEVVQRANERRGSEEKMLLPHVTPHTLRRTFASLCFFAGRDPAWVMGQIGHTDARLTLAVYAQTMQRKRVDRDLVWKLMRFADEPEQWPSARRIDPANDPLATESPSGGAASMRHQ